LVLARSVLPLNCNQVDREVALAFEGGDARKPIVLGLLWKAGDRRSDIPDEHPAPMRVPVAATVDGDQLVFTAEREIVFRCGEASITLTRAGKVLIRGKYLLSRSSGVNRIKGGSVQLN
jgi:hypothetical protein